LREKDISNTVSGFIGAFVFSLGMSFIPASVVSYIIKEREINIKH
jgi:ATP-binding cassette subfamily A (ABC1) protein 3